MPKQTFIFMCLLAALVITFLSPWPGVAQDDAEPETAVDAAADETVAETPLPESMEDIDPDAPGFNSCMECHYLLGGKYTEIVEQFRESVHHELDFGCVDCHGGDQTTMVLDDAMSAERGFIGKPDRAAIPNICANCHSDAEVMRQFGGMRTDQLSLYKASVHGKALFEDGDTNVATCMDCHTAHNILRVKNPKSSVYKKNIVNTCAQCHAESALMSVYGLDPSIPDQYREGAHGKQLLEAGDMGAPVCNNCHGSHGAAPPGVESIEHICGQCHLLTEKYYNQSKHSEAFEMMGMGRCIVCHNQHALQKPTDDYFDETSTANCGICHTEDTDEFNTILAMKDTIDTIRGLHEEAAVLVDETEKTTHLSMHDMIPQVEQIRTKLLTSRILQHTTNLEEMQANQEEAEAQFGEIESYTVGLLERSKFNKMMVAILAILMFGYGVFLLIYKKTVLDIRFPWQTYEGPPVDGKS